MKWILMAKRADFKEISLSCGISQVLARLIRNRDVTGIPAVERFLGGTLEDIPSPSLLSDSAKAVRLLSEGIDAGRKIRIVGDYDVDGICASYIFYRALTACGADTDAVLPERVKDGYGINLRMVRDAAQEKVEILLTCDNGIAAAEPVREAAEMGMKVIVTDHHEIPFSLLEDGRKQYNPPMADAVVDPKMVDPSTGQVQYPFSGICGAAVAYKLSQLLLEQRCVQEREKLLRELLPFCALATVCDVMPLQEENRIFVREGLLEMAKTSNTGLRALLQVTGLWGCPLSCYHAGFILGPCLNASGRLDSAVRGLHLFMERDPARALLMAQELKDLNDRRKSMTFAQSAAAEEIVEQTGIGRDKVFVLYLPDCHESLAGIIAGRIREKYHHPSFVLTDTDGGFLKGSGRSVEAFDMYEAMTGCSDLLEKFGGHRMAGGLTIRKEYLETFRKRINMQCSLTEEEMQDILRIDMELPPGLMSINLVKEFSLLEPCGTGNPRPLFVTRGITLTAARVLGQNRNVIRLRGIDETGQQIVLIRFEEEQSFAQSLTGGADNRVWTALLSGYGDLRIDAVYYPEINVWNGRESLQFIIADYRRTAV